MDAWDMMVMAESAKTLWQTTPVETRKTKNVRKQKTETQVTTWERDRTQLKIGWGLDGCLAEINNTAIYTIRGDYEAKMLYYSTLKPQVHPEFFAGKNDELYIITCREESLREVTEKWCKKWFPQCMLIFAPTQPWRDKAEWQEWFKKVAETKARHINELKLDVYFEDMPETVRWLRQLCPNTMIIQYGGQVES